MLTLDLKAVSSIEFQQKSPTWHQKPDFAMSSKLRFDGPHYLGAKFCGLTFKTDCSQKPLNNPNWFFSSERFGLFLLLGKKLD